MNEEKLRSALRHGLSIRTFSQEDRRAVWRKVKGETRMRRKWTAGAVLAAALMLALCATALAVAARYGILEFEGSLGMTQEKLERLSRGMQSDLGAVQVDSFTISAREAYYDGNTLLIAVDFIPEEEHVMMLSADFEFDEDRYAWLAQDERYGEKTGLDVYREGRFEKLCTVDVHVYDEDADNAQDVSWNGRANPDGSLTVCYRVNKPEKTAQMSMRMTGLIIEDPTPESWDGEGDAVWHKVDCTLKIRIPEA